MQASPSARVQVHGLAKRYGAVPALSDVSFDVAGGEVFGLLGRNGAGKTTTLECLLGLRTPDAGRVIVDGIDAQAEPERARAVIGAQLQAASLQDKITPRQALRFFASFFRPALPADALLERFALQAKADAPFHTLSGGQRQRLFLALAFVHRPGVVVLDEPTAGLDPAARRELHAAITALRADGVAVLMSTHDLAEAEALCDRVGILERGRIVAMGAPHELVAVAHRRPAMVVRAEHPIVPEDVAKLPGVIGVQPERGGLLLECTYLNHVLVALMQYLTGTGNTLVELQIRRPSLEDAFLELTGTRWDGDAPAGAGESAA